MIVARVVQICTKLSGRGVGFAIRFWGVGGAGNLGFASNGRRPECELTNDRARR
jgi:hypothetical protein